MAKKPAQKWVCSACDGITSGWFGRCPSCGAWNSVEEVTAAPEKGDRVVLSATPKGQAAKVVSAAKAAKISDQTPRIPTQLPEFDRVLGGGFVAGSLVLLGGAPGIGKSTLLLQACAGLANSGHRVLYVSAEESVSQIASRAARVAADLENLLLLAETRMEEILDAAHEHKPDLLVVDSIQTVYAAEQDGLPGNVTQIRAVTAKLLTWAKTRNVPVVVVGHVTKDGQLAGPRLLEHMVDTVLSFEGDEERATRLLRASKNRFGSTQELGVFEMTGEGLRQIENPSEVFLANESAACVGACVTATLEGSRPLLLEVQALLGHTPGGSPRRTCVGADANRLAMLLAVLDRHAGLFVGDHDVFVNIAGGMKLNEPASDLAVALAVASSHLGRPLPHTTLAIGEIGLTGELRRVARLDERLAEARRLGFQQAIIAAPKDFKVKPGGEMRLLVARNISEAVERAFND